MRNSYVIEYCFASVLIWRMSLLRLPVAARSVNHRKVTVFYELDKYKCLFLATDDSSTENCNRNMEGMVLPFDTCDHCIVTSLTHY